MEPKIGLILPSTFLEELVSSVDKDGITILIQISKNKDGLRKKTKLLLRLIKSNSILIFQTW